MPKVPNQVIGVRYILEIFNRFDGIASLPSNFLMKGYVKLAHRLMVEFSHEYAFAILDFRVGLFQTTLKDVS
jgi:hypothetical protein